LRQRGIFCIFSIGFGTVAIASYFFYWFCNCCDSAVFFVFFSIGIGTVATAWYFFLLVFELLRQRGKKYHAIATVPNPIEKNTKNTTLSQQFQNQ
jgi:hypothetical protein